MSTVLECTENKLIDILATDIIASASFEEFSDTVAILLDPESYHLLISSSELMSCAFKKIQHLQKNNFIVYPTPKNLG
jgi:hypothetical protein